MTEVDKVNFLIGAISNLSSFSTDLNEDNLDKFEELKEHILDKLSGDERVRFSQIKFYTKHLPLDNTYSDDLPF